MDDGGEIKRVKIVNIMNTYTTAPTILTSLHPSPHPFSPIPPDPKNAPSAFEMGMGIFGDNDLVPDKQVRNCLVAQSPR